MALEKHSKTCDFGRSTPYIQRVKSSSLNQKTREGCGCFQDLLLGFIGRREKTPTPKTRVSIWTLLRTPGRFTTRPLPVYFTTKNVRSKAVFGP